MISSKVLITLAKPIFMKIDVAFLTAFGTTLAWQFDLDRVNLIVKTATGIIGLLYISIRLFFFVYAKIYPPDKPEKD